MAKRFVDTRLFDDEWFMGLSDKGKLFWVFLFTKCDHAGIVKTNDTMFKFFLKTEDLEPLYEEMGKRVVRLDCGYIFLPKFISFQYPNGLSEEVNAQASAKAILIRFGLWDSSSGTLRQEFINRTPTVGQEFLKGWGTVDEQLGNPCPTPQYKKEKENKSKNTDMDEEKYKDTDSVIDHLNEKAGSKYLHKKSAREPIQGRLEDGHSVDDCKLVIDFKVNDWLGTDQEQYIRPITLFGPKKFEGYLFAAQRWVKAGRPHKRGLKEFEQGEREYPEGEEMCNQ